MSLRNRAILVTGGAGFIGSHLVDRLVAHEPEKVIVVDNFYLGSMRNLAEAKAKFPRLVVLDQDASDRATMRKIIESEGIDVVFNLAVIPLPASLEDPDWCFGVNVELPRVICEFARAGLFETLVHFSSSEVYGTGEYFPIDERHPLGATTPYAASKAAGDLLVQSYHRTFGVDMTIVRPFNNYGPRQNDGTYAGVIPITMRRLLQGERAVVHGDGEQTRDYVYVEDTAEAAILAYERRSTRGRAVNVASGRGTTINELVGILVKATGSTHPVAHGPPRPGDVRHQCGDGAAAERLLGFRPSTSMEEGLRKTVHWYRENSLAVRAPGPIPKA